MNRLIRYEAVSDIGCVRTNNEDMAYAAGQFVRDGALTGERSSGGCVAFAVADGIGGCEGGEVASEIVCRSFAAFVKTIDGAPDIERLKQWAKKANDLVLDTAALRPELLDMGTTFIGLVFFEKKCYLLNVGDSRCYRIRSNILKQLSTDHSERQLKGDPDIPSNLICNFMGQNQDTFFSDVIELTTLENDLYLLCSDGLSDLVDDDVIETKADDIKDLVSDAKKLGGTDNITVVKIRI